MIYDDLSFFLYCHSTCGILVPWPGIQPFRLALEAQSLNHSAAREVSQTVLNKRGSQFLSTTQCDAVVSVSPCLSHTVLTICYFPELILLRREGWSQLTRTKETVKACYDLVEDRKMIFFSFLLKGVSLL